MAYPDDSAVATTPAAVRQRREETRARRRKNATVEAVRTSCGRRRVMDETGVQCAECLGPVSAAVLAQHGASLCPQCAEQFYRPCAGCGGLIPQDEAVLHNGALRCVQCLTSPAPADATEALSAAELSVLVAEFVRLHAEAKQLNDRLEEIKEKLKQHAASQPRVANAVLLRTGEYAVKCGYRVSVSYNAEKLPAVEAMLGAEQFTT